MNNDELIKVDHWRCTKCGTRSSFNKTICTNANCQADLLIYGEAIQGVDVDAMKAAYDRGLALEREADSAEKWYAAAADFDEAGDYEDAQYRAQQCRSSAQNAAEAEKLRMAYERALELEKEAKEAAEFRLAADAFEEIGDYLDALARAGRCREKERIMRKQASDYSLGVQAEGAAKTAGDWTRAAEFFKDAGNYKDASARAMACQKKAAAAVKSPEPPVPPGPEPPVFVKKKQEKKEKKDKKSRKVVAGIIIALLLLLILGALFVLRGWTRPDPMPSPMPTFTAAPNPTAAPTDTPAPVDTPSPTTTPVPTPDPTATPEPTPDPTAAPTESPTPRPVLTPVDRSANILYNDSVSFWCYNGSIARSKIKTITFLDTTEDAPAGAWDASLTQNGKVLAWTEDNGSYYDLYIAGNGGVTAPENSHELFGEFSALEEINFNGYFSTDKATNMWGMFHEDRNLKSLDLSGFDTSSATDMGFMFNECRSLTELDLTSFDTSRVTSMCAMFSDTRGLEYLDISSFDTSRVKDMSMMFSDINSYCEIHFGVFDTSSVTDYDFFANRSDLRAIFPDN